MRLCGRSLQFAEAKHVNTGRNTPFVILLNTADEIFGWQFGPLPPIFLALSSL